MPSDADQNPIDLTGQVAIVTGGGRGLGRAYAQALAAHGAAVAVVARSADQVAAVSAAIKDAGGRALHYALDVTDRQAVEQMTADVEQQLGPVNLLVNNAGVVQPLGLFWDTDPDEWWRTMEINVRSMLLCARAILPGMVHRHRGRIINLASGAGTAAIPYGSAYVTTKTAMIRLTEILAAETKEYGISVFAIHPGNVRSAMTEYLAYSSAGQRWAPGFRKIFDEGRDNSITESVQLVLRLAAGHADALSGCYLSVDYDLKEMVRHAADIAAKKSYLLRIKTLG